MNGQVLLVYGSRTCLGSPSDDEVRRLSCRADTLGAARTLGYDTAIFTPSDACTPTDTANRIVAVDLRSPEDVVEAARKLNAQQPVVAVLCCEEDALVSSAMIAAELGLPAHPVEAAFAAMDKPTMKELFRAAGVPTADFTVAADEDDAVRWAAATGYPVVVKPSRSGASQGVIRADNEDELRAAYRRLRRIVRDYGLDHGGRPAQAQLVERYVDGAEVSCELIIQDGEPEIYAIFEKPLPLTGPFFEETIYITPSSLPGSVQREIERISIAAAMAIGLRHGPAHCELRLTDDGPYVLEIAGRYLGALCTWVFRDRLGEDIQETFIKVATGQQVEVPKPLPDAPVTGAMILPVPGEGRIVAVHGAERASRVPGIRDAVVIACPGDLLVPFPEQTCYPIGFLTAAGPSQEAVADSLTWAAGSISVELAPVGRDRWTRPMTAADAESPSQTRYPVRTMADMSLAQARETAVDYLAAAMYEELPADEGRAAAREMLKNLETGGHGEPAWVFVPGAGCSLGFVDGALGYLGWYGVLPGQQGALTDMVLARHQLAEFARRGCTAAVSDTDPRLPLAPRALRGLGFRMQPPASSSRPVTEVLSCSLAGLEQRRARAQAAAADCGGGECCCECPG